MGHTKRAIMRALYAPHELTDAERRFIGDLDAFRATMGAEPIDPESIPGHDYATEAEALDRLESTTVPAIARQNNPTEVP